MWHRGQHDDKKSGYRAKAKRQQPPDETTAALGLRKPGDSIVDPGFFSLPNSRHQFRDWKKDGHGVVDLKRSISQSRWTIIANTGVCTRPTLHRLPARPLPTVKNRVSCSSRLGVSANFTGNAWQRRLRVLMGLSVPGAGWTCRTWSIHCG